MNVMTALRKMAKDESSQKSLHWLGQGSGWLFQQTADGHNSRQGRTIFEGDYSNNSSGVAIL